MGLSKVLSAPFGSRGCRKHRSEDAESDVPGGSKAGTKLAEVGQRLAEMGRRPSPSSGRLGLPPLTITKQRRKISGWEP